MVMLGGSEIQPAEVITEEISVSVSCPVSYVHLTTMAHSSACFQVALPLSHQRTSLTERCTTARLRHAHASRICATMAPAQQDAATTVTQDLGLMRIGHGYDLHRLEEGRALVLGGLDLPHNVGCAGHSDGDAVYHCVVDAILGALALPDIGQLFPDTDPRFKDQKSHVFMTAAYARMHLAGYRVGNLDVTLIIERPKIAPHKEKMRANIAELLQCPISAVNLKAKTHEKVDAVGENRAVEVHAVVVLLKDNEGWTPQPEPTENDTITTGRQVTTAMLGAVASRAAEIAGIKMQTKSDVEMEARTRSEANEKAKSDNSSQATGVNGDALQALYERVCERARADKDSSWTAKLFSKGREKIAQKVGEEAVEVVIDSIADKSVGVVKESADLLYHMCVLWAHMGIEPQEVFDELKRRQSKSGIAEKAGRVEK